MTDNRSGRAGHHGSVLGSNRRAILIAAGTSAFMTAGSLTQVARAVARTMPTRVARIGDIALPDTDVARAAAALARAASPTFLYNHCIRTYLFGCLRARRDRLSYDAEMLFVASALHDLGLVERFSSRDRLFEIDGADAAKRFLVERGVAEARAELVWNAIALHTSQLVDHQSPQTALVGAGAGTDVYGAGPKTLPAADVEAILKAYPRHGFAEGFRGLLLDYCRRKPLAQVGGWTDAFCRGHGHGVAFPQLDRGLDTFPADEN